MSKNRTRQSDTRRTSTGEFVVVGSKSGMALHNEMRAFATTLRNDKTAARAFLVKAGIVTPKGNLRKVYGG